MPAPGNRAIRSIAVLGGGIVGLSAGLAFSRAFAGVRITIVETPPDPAALADRMPGSWPSIHRFHDLIGLSETDLVRSGAATPRLGIGFRHWSADDEPWFHIFGDYGLPMGAVPFHHVWARVRRAGTALPYHRYSAAASLAAAGRFAHPVQDGGSALSTYDYALRLDPDLYRALLATRCDTAGAARSAGTLGGVARREDGGIAALLLIDGRRVEADLFVDCAGPSAPLLSALAGDFEDWGASLPCDRLLLGQAPQAGPSSCDSATAVGIGWRWVSPIPGRAMAGLAYASDVTTEGKARQLFASAGGAPESEAVSIRPGRRPSPWLRNVVAIGDSAIAVDMLEWTNLHLAQSAIMQAVELMPGRDCHPVELAEYDRRVAQEAGRIHDFLSLHYLASGRRAGDFWKNMGGRRTMPDLGRTVRLFESRGRLPFYEEDVARQSWLAVLLGMGVLPRHTDPVAAGADPGEAAAGMERLAAAMARLPDGVPAYGDYLARMTASARRSA